MCVLVYSICAVPLVHVHTVSGKKSMVGSFVYHGSALSCTRRNNPLFRRNLPAVTTTRNKTVWKRVVGRNLHSRACVRRYLLLRLWMCKLRWEKKSVLDGFVYYRPVLSGTPRNNPLFLAKFPQFQRQTGQCRRGLSHTIFTYSNLWSKRFFFARSGRPE